MKPRRVERLNSLLKEVISDVIVHEVKNPDVHPLITVTSVEISPDLHHAKVYISVIGSPEDKKKSLDALATAAGFIAVNASKKVVLRHFPSLVFKLDTSVDEHMKIQKILKDLEEERSSRDAE